MEPSGFLRWSGVLPSRTSGRETLTCAVAFSFAHARWIIEASLLMRFNSGSCLKNGPYFFPFNECFLSSASLFTFGLLILTAKSCSSILGSSKRQSFSSLQEWTCFFLFQSKVGFSCFWLKVSWTESFLGCIQSIHPDKLQAVHRLNLKAASGSDLR